MKNGLLIIILGMALLVSCQKESNPPVFSYPDINKESFVSVSYHDAIIVDTITLNNKDVIVRMFYSTDYTIGTNNFHGAMIKVIPEVRTYCDKIIVTSTLSNLTDGTNYYYVYGFVSPYNEKFRDGLAALYSQSKTFTTLKNGAPNIKTDSVSNIGFYTANLTVEKVSDNSDSKPTEWGVCFSDKPNVTESQSKLFATSDNDGKMSFTAENLNSGTTYYYRAYGINNYGTSYGEEKSFTTTSANVMKLETLIPTEKGSTYAVLTGKVTCDTTGLNITERGFLYSSANITPTENDQIIKSQVSGEGSFQCTVTDLSPYTTYYVRMYAICQYGKLYGNVIAFTTEK